MSNCLLNVLMNCFIGLKFIGPKNCERLFGWFSVTYGLISLYRLGRFFHKWKNVRYV